MPDDSLQPDPDEDLVARARNGDTRAFDVPRWILVMWSPLSFLLMGTEFLRFIVRREEFLGPQS